LLRNVGPICLLRLAGQHREIVRAYQSGSSCCGREPARQHCCNPSPRASALAARLPCDHRHIWQESRRPCASPPATRIYHTSKPFTGASRPMAISSLRSRIQVSHRPCPRLLPITRAEELPSNSLCNPLILSAATLLFTEMGGRMVTHHAHRIRFMAARSATAWPSAPVRPTSSTSDRRQHHRGMPCAWRRLTGDFPRSGCVITRQKPPPLYVIFTNILSRRNSRLRPTSYELSILLRAASKLGGNRTWILPQSDSSRQVCKHLSLRQRSLFPFNSRADSRRPAHGKPHHASASPVPTISDP